MNILMIAYYFPPDSSSGSFRPLYFANYFASQGDNVQILTARQLDFLPDQPLDKTLLITNLDINRTRVFRPRERLIELKNRFFPSKSSDQALKPEDSIVISRKTGNDAFGRLKDMITLGLSCPDPHIGWLPPALLKGLELIKTHKIDLIYATGSPWTSLLLGSVLKMMTKTPLVLDFRDPWTQNPGFMVREKLFQWGESFMEKKVVTLADLVVANTKELEIDFQRRFGLSSKKVITVTNGFNKVWGSVKFVNTSRFTITHAGSLYFSRNPKYLLRAVLNLVETGVFSHRNFLINFIGGISIEDQELKKLLENKQIREVLEIIPRISFDEVCKYQIKSDVLFLIQPDFPLQVPRKLYEYMAFGKPVLGITNLNGATANILREKKIGLVVENQVQQIQAALVILFEQWKENRLSGLYKGDCQDYSNTVLCRKMRFCLHSISKKTSHLEKNGKY